MHRDVRIVQMECAMEYTNMGSKFILIDQLHEAAIINFQDDIFGKLGVLANFTTNSRSR